MTSKNEKKNLERTMSIPVSERLSSNQPIGLKSICSSLEQISKDLVLKSVEENERHKSTCTNLTNLTLKVDTLIKTVSDMEKQIYIIENN
jgi:hypothetical protein